MPTGLKDTFKKARCLFLFLCFWHISPCQTLNLTGKIIAQKMAALDSVASTYQIIELAAPITSGNYSAVKLPLSKDIVPMQLRDELLGNKTTLNIPQSTRTFKTYQQQNSQKERPFNIGINDNFVMGEFMINDTKFMVEQLGNFVPNSPATHLVVYPTDSTISRNATCGVTEEMIHEYNQTGNHADNIHNETLSTCRTIDYAMVADYTMYKKYNTIQGVVNYLMGIMNLVQGNYDNEFANEYRFKINHIQVFTSPVTNPWPGTDNISTNLNNFRTWADQNMKADYDISSYWFSTTGFQSGTVGLAYLSYTCNRQGSNAIREYGTSANLMRVLVAHEIGHNLSSGHDGAGTNFIMSPSVNNTQVWSAQSLSAINNFFAGTATQCMTACQSQPCHNSFAPNLQANYDTANNRINLTWTIGENIPTRIRWQNVAANTWDSAIISNPTGSYTLNLTCGPTLYRIDLAQRCGLSSQYSIAISTDISTVSTKPLLAWSTPRAVCPGGSSTIEATPRVNNYQYRWLRNNTIIGGQTTPNLTVNQSGHYRVEINNGNGCWVPSATDTFQVVSAPIPNFGFRFESPTHVSFFDSSILADSYAWDFGNGTTATGETTTLQEYATNGIKDVTLTITGCGGAQNAVTKPLLIGIDEMRQVHNPWGLREGLVFSGNNCINQAAFLGSTPSRHLLAVGNQFPASGTIEWRFFATKGFNNNNPNDTNTIYLAGNASGPSMHGSFQVFINTVTKQITARIRQNNSITNYNAILGNQIPSLFNRWVAIGLSYGNNRLTILIDGAQYVWSPANPIILGGAPTINGNTNYISTGNHFDMFQNTMVGFNGMVDKIRVSPLHEDFFFRSAEQVYLTASSGNWNNMTTWRAPYNVPPGICDSVVVSEQHNITITQPEKARAVRVNKNATVTITASGSLEVRKEEED